MTLPTPRDSGDLRFAAVTRRLNADARAADLTRQRISRTVHGDCQLALYWLLAHHPAAVAEGLDWAQASR